MCHKIVTEMSQDCPAVSRDVADVSPDVTEMSRPSHIFVTRCHKLSQQLSHQSRSVTECQYICRRVDKLTYTRCAGGSFYVLFKIFTLTPGPTIQYTQKIAPFTPPLRDLTTLGIAPRVSHDSIAPAASHRRTQHDMRTPCTPSFTRTAVRSVHTHAQSLCSHSSMHTPNTQHIRPRPAPGTRDHRRAHGGPNSPSGTPPCAPPCPPPCGPQPGAGSGASRAGMPAGRGMAASGSGGGPAATRRRVGHPVRQ